jgi:hypothetical protein
LIVDAQEQRKMQEESLDLQEELDAPGPAFGTWEFFF